MQRTLDAQLKKDKMNKLVCKITCGWNWVIAKLMISVKDCPNKLCTCKK